MSDKGGIRGLRVTGSFLSFLSVSGSLRRDSPAIMLKRAFSAIDDTPDTLGLQSETQSENDAATHDKKDAPMASTATMTTLVRL